MNDRSLQGTYAGFVSRAVGLAIDVLITTITVAVTSWFLITVLSLFGINAMNCPDNTPVTWWTLTCNLSTLFLVLFAALFFPTYLVLFWTLTGETPGMRIMGVRVVRSDGRRLSLWVAIKRLFGYFVCFFTLGLGFLWVLLDDQRQGLHDIIAGTVVIYAWDARLRARFIDRMQRTALRAKTTAQVARELGADAWAGKDYHVVVLTSTDTPQLQQVGNQLITWYQQNPPQVLLGIMLTKDALGKVSVTELPEILPPTSVVLASNPKIPRLSEVRGDIYQMMNDLPDGHGALVTVIDQPLVSSVVVQAGGAEISVYKGGWAKTKTTVAMPGAMALTPFQPASDTTPAAAPAPVGAPPADPQIQNPTSNIEPPPIQNPKSKIQNQNSPAPIPSSYDASI